MSPKLDEKDNPNQSGDHPPEEKPGLNEERRYKDELARGQKLLEMKRKAFHPDDAPSMHGMPEPITRILFAIPIFILFWLIYWYFRS